MDGINIIQVESNRDNPIALINATEYEAQEKLLLQELWYADLHSLGSDPYTNTEYKQL